MTEKQIELAADFWTCNCDETWIHRNEVNDCPRCGTVKNDAEPATVDEVAFCTATPLDQIRRLSA